MLAADKIQSFNSATLMAVPLRRARLSFFDLAQIGTFRAEIQQSFPVIC